MAGYVKGSKAHYEFLINLLIDISGELKSTDVSLEEKTKLYLKQVKIMEHLDQYFPDGEPKWPSR